MGHDFFDIQHILFCTLSNLYFRLACKLSNIVAVAREAHLDVKFEIPI